MLIRELMPTDWPGVLEIYEEGLVSGKSTFNTVAPSWDEWNAGHSNLCRFVAQLGDEIAGFAAVSPVSSRAPYRGVVEVSVYVSGSHQHRGIGTALLKKLIDEAPRHGFWSLYSAIISKNTASIALHEKCGFRTVGYRERIARDRFGNWADTTLMEYRLPDECVQGL